MELHHQKPYMYTHTRKSYHYLKIYIYKYIYLIFYYSDHHDLGKKEISLIEIIIQKQKLINILYNSLAQKSWSATSSFCLGSDINMGAHLKRNLDY